MKVAVGRCPETGAPLASQSTIISSGECAEQDRGGAADCGSARSVRHEREAGQAGDPRHRRHVLRGAWRPAACVLERASRRARLCVDAHLSRGERQTGRDDPAPGTHPEGHRGEDRHQACDEAPAQTLAEDPHRVARRQPLRPRRGDGMGGRQRCGLHFRPRRQCRARCPGGGDRRPICASIMR